MNTLDLLIIGAGPSGLACGIEAGKNNLDYLIVEKGGITESIRRFPVNMTFFSTPELLELGGLPFSTSNLRPTRAEALEYYRAVVEFFNLRILLHTAVGSITTENGIFVAHTGSGQTLRAKHLIFATGYFDYPNLLGVKGESLPHVSHYYDEPYRYTKTHVVIVGAGNSAVEAALDLYRHGATVTVVHRGPALGKSVKYWVRPDLENRLNEGAINAHFNSEIVEIRYGEIDILDNTNEEKHTLRADFVFLLTGYQPDAALLSQIGVELDEQSVIPTHNAKTRETNVDNVYVAGSVACGCETGNIFIENGRLHALDIMASILAKQ